ncbi:hypothetical protein GDO86_004268 [Hymenochirus boettgeri]|uniref:Uncharacterized protein n=1 Tax=Hymenochirus boettgeri TaxID=247094 RepID=A0A8T2K9W5_9PIPI|nr:hypothetical protein GDO86_004268 [Hymenochirus boettgeri]
MGKRRKQRKEDVISSLTKRQKKHLKEFGEQHPFYDQINKRQESTQVVHLNESSEDESGRESEAESEPEQVNMYHRLLATLKNVSDEEEDESEEEEDDDDNDERLEAENEEEIDQISSDEAESEGDPHNVEESEEDPSDADEREEEGPVSGHTKEAEVISSLDKDGEEVEGQEGGALTPEEGNEFTDLKHESKFSLETNFMDDDENGEQTKEPVLSSKAEGKSFYREQWTPYKCPLFKRAHIYL